MKIISTHHKNCRLPNCPHRGCTDTKPLLLHVKICIAGPNFPCPAKYKGCNEARKLMAHYRKCKDVRSRQQQQTTGLVGRQLHRPTDQGSCLVCSLMARYAKSMMERTAAISHHDNNLSSQLKNDHSTAATTTTTITSSIIDGKVITDENGLANFATHHPFHPKRSPSMTLMPPPPPRRLSHLLLPNGSKMNDRINSGVTIPILWPSSSSLSSLGSIVEDDGLLVVPYPSTINNNNNLRQRAVSYDERQSMEFDGVQPPETSASRSGRCHSDMRGNEECNATIPSSSSRGHKCNVMNNSRPRSASCSNLTMGCNNTGILRSLPSHHECGTIAED